MPQRFIGFVGGSDFDALGAPDGGTGTPLNLKTLVVE